jgi:hypothetical protein
MTHISSNELHDVAYELEPPMPHLGECAACRKALAAIEKERMALREILQGETQPRWGSPWTWALAATLLVGLGVVMAIPSRIPEESQPARNQAEAEGEMTLGEWIHRYVNGDDSVRAKILASGTPAMHLLRPHRKDKRVLALTREIRLTAAKEDERKTWETLEGQRMFGLASEDGPLSGTMQILGRELRVPILVDPAAVPALHERKITFDYGEKPGTALELLEEIAEQVDADFAYLYGGVLIAAPDRLWSKEPARIRLLSEAERRRAKEWVLNLGAEGLEERDRAYHRLRGLGSGGIPILEEFLTHRDPEVVARCRDLLETLRARPPGPVFGTPGVEHQKLSGGDRQLYDKMKEDTGGSQLTVRGSGGPLRNSLKTILLGTEIECRVAAIGEVPDITMYVLLVNASVWTQAALVTQAYELDFIIENGTILVGPKEEIEKRLKE